MLNRITKIFGVIIILVLLLGSGFPFAEKPAIAAEGDESQLKLIEIELPDKGNRKLDSRLNKLAKAVPDRRALVPAQRDSENITEETVRVIVECLSGQVGPAARVAGNHGVVETSYGNLLQVKVPVSRLTALADDPNIRLVRMPQTPIPAAVTSEGVALINADDWQAAGYNGTGVKVGILDGGFSGYASLLGTELPAMVSTNWSASIGNPGTSVHGTACAEIIYDVAPGAQFYLANFDSEVEMGNAVDWMIAQGVDIISCSMGWPIGGPGDGTGPICDIVKTARAAGILWSQSMGNHAQRHWQGDFVDTEPDGWNEFGSGDEGNTISVNSGQTIIVALKWDDTWGASANDYDLYLINNASTVVWGSEGTQDGNDDPWEGLVYTADYTGLYSIAIRRYGAAEGVNFHLYSYYHDLQYQTVSSSLVVPADSPDAMSVGAVDFNTPSTLEPFSSRGPTDGGLTKPDLVAPDGVSTATYGASDFHGTSASAPHAAGAAVLVKNRYPSYTTVQIKSFLESRTVEIGGDGKDNLYGSGRLNLGTPTGNYTLTMAVSGNGFTTPSVGAHNYTPGTVVNISATPTSGWQFDSWTGDVADNTLVNTAVTMDGNKTVTANFISTAYGWHQETVDRTGDVGALPSLAFDSSGQPHVSYWDATNYGLKYAYRGISGWNIQTIYAGHYIGNHSLALDSSGNPHISYHYQDSPALPQYLKYTYWDGFSWQTRIVDNEGDAGSVCSLDLDGSGSPHISYRISSVEDLRYAHWDGSRWQIQTVDNGNMSRANPSLKVDSSGNPHISYHDDTLEDIKYAHWDGSVWQLETIDSEGRVGEFSSLALDSSDNPHISYSYFDRATGDSALKYAYWDGSNWHIEIVDTNGEIAGRNSLALDSAGKPHISYYDDYSEDLKYAYWDGSNWHIEIVDTIGVVGMYNSLAIDVGNNPHIAYYDSSQGDLKHAYRVSIPPTVTTSAASNITATSAILHGNLTNLGEYNSANVSFKWGTASGNLTRETAPEVMTSTGAFSANLSGLAPSTTYYYRARATSNPTVYGDELSFKTKAVLVSANITPDTPTIALGRRQQFTAIGKYSDNSTANITASVTWSSSNTTVATINSSGLARSLALGQTVITATSGNVSANTTLTVSPKVLDTANITPDTPTIALGRTQQFTATGTYSDNSTANITGSVTWSSSNTTVVTINSSGFARSLVLGQTLITATSGNVSANTTLTVSPKVLDTANITPGTPTIVLGRTRQFTANGKYSDNSTANITGSVTWSSSNTTVARINAAGLAKSYAEGFTLITASSGNVSANTTLTVGPAVLDAIIITPFRPTIRFISGSPPTLQFVATASYSNGATAIVTGSANWTSDNTSVATIGRGTGLATTVAAGTTTISANYTGKIGNTTLTVLADTVAPVVTLDSPVEGQVLSANTTIVSGTIDDVSATTGVIVNGGATIALTLGGSGNFSKSISLNTGSNSVLVTAVDGRGNTGASRTVTVEVAPGKPGIAITQPSAGTVTDNSSLNVTGTVSGNVTTANLILNGARQSVAVAGGSFSANVTLVEGTNIIVVNAYAGGHDGDSNYRGTSGVRAVTLDTTPPVITITNPASGSVVSTHGCIVSGLVDDPHVGSVNLILNSASQAVPVVSGNFSQNITLVSGNNTITITATDEVGNTSITDPLAITLDNTKPEVIITSPANGLVTSAASHAVTGTIDDPTITSATLYVNGASQAMSVSSGSFTANATLIAGLNTLEVRASDNATPVNTGTSGIINIFLDNTAPVITIGLSNPTDTITITITSNESLASVPGVSVNSTAVDIGQTGINQWCGTYGSAASPIAARLYTVTANGTDRAGNTTNKTATFCKQTVTIADNETAVVQTNTTTLEINTTANVTGASISVTQHLENPSGNAENPSGAEKAAGIYIEIVASPALRDTLEQIYIRVDYDPDELPENTDESSLKLYLWDIASGTWQVVANSGVNTAEHYIYGTVTHLSEYGGFGTTPPAVPSSPAPPAGGGGGGGAAPGVTSIADLVDSRGITMKDVDASSIDDKCIVTVSKGTKVTQKTGYPANKISVFELEYPPSPPADAKLVGLAYDLGPNGLIFSPPVDLTFVYDPNSILTGVAEEDLVIAMRDASTGKWVELEGCTVDTLTHTITCKVAHFTDFAILAYTRPATFTLSNLSITPQEVEAGNEVTVSVQVANTGNLKGDYQVTFKINNMLVHSENITLAGGASQKVDYITSQGAIGSHTVDVNGLAASFVVKAKANPTPTLTPVPVPVPASPTTPVPVPSPTPLPSQPINWPLVGGAIAALVGVGWLILVLFRRRT